MLGWRHGRTNSNEELSAWEPADDGPRPERILADNEAMQALERALRKLPRRQYETFSLRILNDLDDATTAAAMGCSEGSVKTHLSCARAALRVRLQKQAHEFQHMAPRQQQRVREAYRYYQSLPPERRRSLRQKWQQQAAPQKNRHRQAHDSAENGN